MRVVYDPSRPRPRNLRTVSEAERKAGHLNPGCYFVETHDSTPDALEIMQQVEELKERMKPAPTPSRNPEINELIAENAELWRRLEALEAKETKE